MNVVKTTNLDRLKAKADTQYKQAKKNFFITQFLSYLAYSAFATIKIMDLITVNNMYLIAFVDMLFIAILFALIQKTYTDMNKVFTDWVDYLNDEEKRQMGLGDDCTCGGQVK